MQAGNGRPAGRRHPVLQPPRMLAGLQRHPGRAKHRLRGELQGRLARQSHFHTAVGERLDDEKDIRGPAPAQAGHGVHEPLLHHHDPPD